MIAKKAIPADRPAPDVGIRVVCWLGIYLAGPLPLIFRGASGGLMLIPIFPVILGNIVILPLALFHADGGRILPAIFLTSGWVLGYTTYAIHLVVTLRARTRREFARRLLVLVILVLFNQFMTRALGPITG